MDNIKTWTGLLVEESIRMTEDRDKLRKFVHGVVNPRIENRTEQSGVAAGRSVAPGTQAAAADAYYAL